MTWDWVAVSVQWLAFPGKLPDYFYVRDSRTNACMHSGRHAQMHALALSHAYTNHHHARMQTHTHACTHTHMRIVKRERERERENLYFDWELSLLDI